MSSPEEQVNLVDRETLKIICKELISLKSSRDPFLKDLSTVFTKFVAEVFEETNTDEHDRERVLILRYIIDFPGSHFPGQGFKVWNRLKLSSNHVLADRTVHSLRSFFKHHIVSGRIKQSIQYLKLSLQEKIDLNDKVRL